VASRAAKPPSGPAVAHVSRGGENVSAQFEAQVQKLQKRYPRRRSAVMDALRLAQEQHGWLSPEVLREVADALDETPAYCLSIASFYDMYHLEPVGRHMVEVCTNLSCALAGAQGVLAAFGDALDVAQGGTSEDGEVTLRAIECAGGCGRAPVVVIDHVYHEPVTVEDVPELVERLRG
jgi:NADH-quinone oxidoreductase subunit E